MCFSSAKLVEPPRHFCLPLISNSSYQKQENCMCMMMTFIIVKWQGFFKRLKMSTHRLQTEMIVKWLSFVSQTTKFCSLTKLYVILIRQITKACISYSTVFPSMRNADPTCIFFPFFFPFSSFSSFLLFFFSFYSPFTLFLLAFN